MREGMIFHADASDTLIRLHQKGIEVDLTVCDVPFGVNFANSKYYDDNFQILEVGVEWLSAVYDIHKDNTYIFLYVGSKTIQHWINAMENAGFKYIDTIATQTYTNGNYSAYGFDNSFQPIIYGVKGKKKKLNKIPFIPTSKVWLNDPRNKKKDPHTYNYPNFISRKICSANVKPNKQRKLLHPNEKNVDMLRFFIQLASDEGDTVLDFAMGSGSTLVAAKSVGRKYIGIDIDADCVETTVKRLKEMDGNG